MMVHFRALADFFRHLLQVVRHELILRHGQGLFIGHKSGFPPGKTRTQRSQMSHQDEILYPRLKDPKARSAPPMCSATPSRWYNFARINSAVRMSPAMAARLKTRLWDIADIVKLIEGWESQTNEQN
jgi:hypothetical protein